MKKTNPLKIVEIKNYANNLRRELGFTPDSPFPILDVIEKFYNEGLLTIQYLEDDNFIFECDSIEWLPIKLVTSDELDTIK